MKKMCIKTLCIFVCIIICFSQVFAMQVYIKTQTGTNITLEVESSDTVEYVKQKLIQQEQLEAKEVTLIFGEKTLEEGRTLADYNIQRYDTIHGIIVPNVAHKIIIASSKNGKVVLSHTEAKEGEQITIQVTPNNGYKVKSVSAYKTGEKDTSIELIDNSFVMPEYEVTIEAEFEKKITPILDDTPATGNMDYVFWSITLTISVVGLIITYRKCVE